VSSGLQKFHCTSFAYLYRRKKTVFASRKQLSRYTYAMTDAKHSTPARRARAIAPVLLTLLLTALLHLIAIDWGRTYVNPRQADAATPSTISVTLAPPPLPVALPVAKPKPRKVIKPTPHPTPRTQPPAAIAPPPQPLLTTDDTSSTGAPPAAAVDGIGNGNEEQTKTASPVAPETAANSHTEGVHYQLAPPPAAMLEYQVNAFADHLEWHGASTLDWKSDGNHYSVEGEVYMRFFAKITMLSFVSSGEIDDFGIAPEIYTEKKRNRAATNTHFNRERNVINFSASTINYPRVGGEQDRASVIWQLAAIGRGDSNTFAVGKVIDLFVAGVRDGEVWRMQVAALEDLKLSSGHIQAWHIVRQPRPGSYEQRLDIWLAPEAQWYPVRLRFTETNGDYLEMTVSNLKTL